ncbi:MAG: GNAT family N-acetyltransferase [Aggregatilineales bacterium]
MSLNIIRADLEHVEWIVPLFDAYRVFYKQDSDIKNARRFLEHRVKNGESVIFLAMDGDSALGFVQMYPSFSSVNLRELWILNDLFVVPGARGQGVGAALLEHARQFARTIGVRTLVLQTANDNEPAQTLYEKLGWKRESGFVTYYLNV